MARVTVQSPNPLEWLFTPMLLSMAGAVLLALPVKLFGLQLPEPVFPLALAFAWAVIRPSILAPFALLALGLFLDLFWDGPFGLWALALLVAYAATLSVRRVLSGLGWWGLGGWYVVAVALAMGAGVAITMMDSAVVPSLVAVAWQTLACLALFPLSYRLIERFEDADVRFR